MQRLQYFHTKSNADSNPNANLLFLDHIPVLNRFGCLHAYSMFRWHCLKQFAVVPFRLQLNIHWSLAATFVLVRELCDCIVVLY